jgi:Family of unknown function (DUF6338)
MENMTPTNSIIEFVIYVTPGFLVTEVYHAFFPVKPSSDFSKVTWSVINGICLFVLLHWLDIKFFHGHLHSGQKEFPNFAFAAYLLYAGLIIGYARVLVDFLRERIALSYAGLKGVLPDPQSIWAKVNMQTNRDWAVVFLDDNSIYLGNIKEYTFDPSSKDQDFLLSKARRVDEFLKEMYQINGTGVYLNTRNVKRIEFVKGE